MRAKLEGVVLEKILKPSKEDNQDPKLQVRLYQKGEKVNTDVTVSRGTYDKAKEGTKIEIDCSIGVYTFNGQAGMYAKEVDNF